MEACIAGIIPDVMQRATDRRLVLAILLAAPAIALATAGSDDALSRAEQALAEGNLPVAAREFAAASLQSDDPKVAERAAQLTFGTGYDAWAEQAVSRWTELVPANPLPRELLGRLKLRRRAVDEAVPDLVAALGSGEPRRDEVYLALAADLAQEDDQFVVTRVLARLTGLDPLAGGLQLALGRAALRSGDFDLALAAAAEAALDDPDDVEPELLRVRALLGLEQKVAAVAALDRLAERAGVPATPPSLGVEVVGLYADAGEAAKARLALDGLRERFGALPEIERLEAFIALAGGDLPAADERFARLDAALEGAGQARFEGFYFRGRLAEERGDFATARRWFARVSSGTYLVPATLATAESLAAKGDRAGAIAVLRDFQRSQPAEAHEVLPALAELQRRFDDPEGALATWGQALEYQPANVAVLLARGTLFEQLGQLQEALADLRLAAELAPDVAAALNAYGYTLVNRTAQRATGWRYVRRAYELQPDSPAIQDSVGWALFKQGRLLEARSHLEEANAGLADPEIQSHLAEVHWALGDRDLARTMLEAAAASFPDSVPVRSAVERLLK
jgi:tetratricopeptide (TPR) repeat protein